MWSPSSTRTPIWPGVWPGSGDEGDVAGRGQRAGSAGTGRTAPARGRAGSGRTRPASACSGSRAGVRGRPGANSSSARETRISLSGKWCRPPAWSVCRWVMHDPADIARADAEPRSCGPISCSGSTHSRRRSGSPGASAGSSRARDARASRRCRRRSRPRDARSRRRRSEAALSTPGRGSCSAGGACRGRRPPARRVVMATVPVWIAWIFIVVLLRVRGLGPAGSSGAKPRRISSATPSASCSSIGPPVIEQPVEERPAEHVEGELQIEVGAQVAALDRRARAPRAGPRGAPRGTRRGPPAPARGCWAMAPTRFGINRPRQRAAVDLDRLPHQGEQVGAGRARVRDAISLTSAATAAVTSSSFDR